VYIFLQKGKPDGDVSWYLSFLSPFLVQLLENKDGAEILTGLVMAFPAQTRISALGITSSTLFGIKIALNHLFRPFLLMPLESLTNSLLVLAKFLLQSKQLNKHQPTPSCRRTSPNYGTKWRIHSFKPYPIT
jgi:hypothetical protein